MVGCVIDDARSTAGREQSASKVQRLDGLNEPHGNPNAPTALGLQTHFTKCLDHARIRSPERRDFPVVEREHDRPGKMPAQNIAGVVRVEKSDRRHLGQGGSFSSFRR